MTSPSTRLWVLVAAFVVCGILIGHAEDQMSPPRPSQSQTSPVPATPQNAASFVGDWTITTSAGPMALSVKVLNAMVVGEVTTRFGTHHATLKIAGRSLLAGYDFDEQGVSSDAVLVLTPNDKANRIDAHVDFANGAPRLTGTATKK